MNPVKQRFWNWLLVLVMLLAVLGLLTLSSCEKEEPLWKLPPPGAEQTGRVAMGENYETTIYYKFSTQNSIARNLNTWHLALESKPDGWHIRINGGRAMQVWRTGTTNFDDSFTPSEQSNWDWDTPDGNEDSTAIGNLLSDTTGKQSQLQVYIVDMGLNAANRYKKLQVLSVNDTSYTIKHANTDNSNLHTVTIRKSGLSTYNYFDLTTNTIADYEPAPELYDIKFERYRYVFIENGVPTPYLVNGALLNTVNTSAVRLSSTNFDSVTYDIVKDIPLSTKNDTIGYDWKYYDFDLSLYTIAPNLFVVKDREGNYWKLQFYDFYNDSGIKGYPTFKFQRL